MAKSPFGFGDKPKSRNLDFGGMPQAPAEPTPEREAAALKRGEDLGFVARETKPDQAPAGLEAAHAGSLAQNVQGRAGGSPVVRRRPGAKVPMRSIFVKGPETELNEFIAYVNENGYSAYWEAIRDLMARR